MDTQTDTTEPAVIEHPSTIAVLREHYYREAEKALLRKENEYRYQNFELLGSEDNPLRKCTILQLRAVVRLCDNARSPLLLKSYAPDHLGIMLASIYVGIEPDGYTHS